MRTGEKGTPLSTPGADSNRACKYAFGSEQVRLLALTVCVLFILLVCVTSTILPVDDDKHFELGVAGGAVPSPAPATAKVGQQSLQQQHYPAASPSIQRPYQDISVSPEASSALIAPEQPSPVLPASTQEEHPMRVAVAPFISEDALMRVRTAASPNTHLDLQASRAREE